MKKRPRKIPQSTKTKPTTLRVIGGSMRGRRIRYSGDRVTRPMRDSVRENLFNILGDDVAGATVVDPFCGTGVLVAEAFSRGAKRAIAMDLDRRALKQIEENLAELDLLQQTTLAGGDAFRGLGGLLENVSAEESLIVFLCPPYEMFDKRLKDLNRMILHVSKKPNDGLLVAESDGFFDTEQLVPAQWDIRRYGVTQLAVTNLRSIRQSNHTD